MLEKIESIEPKAGPLYAIAAGGDFLFVGGSSKWVYAFPLNHLEFPKFQINLESSAYTLFFHEESNRLWVGQSNGELAIIDLASKEFAKRYALGSPGLFALCPMGDEMLVGGGDGKVSVWDIHSLEFKRVFTLSDSKVRRIIPSQRGVYCAFSNGSIEELDLVYGNRLAKWEAHRDGVFALATHPNKPVVFSGGKDGMLRGWNTQNQQLVFEFPAHESAVYDVVFVNEANHFVTASRDKKIKVWSAKNLEHQFTVEATRSVNRLEKLSDVFIASVGDDGQLAKWSVNAN